MLTLVAALALATQQSDYRERFPIPPMTVPEGWGVNVRLADMTEKDMNAMRDVGAKWVRLDLLWSRVEQKLGVYDFSKYDPVMEGLRRRGIRPILILDYGNKLYDVVSPTTREGRQAFAKFAAEAVKRYRRQGVIWEIWNEPNLSHFWRGEPSADEYAALVDVVVPAIREVSKDEWIMGPSTSKFDWPYLERSFEKGILEDVDAVSVHPYRENKEPETAGADWQRLRTMIDRYAPSGKKIPMICSEWGYSTFKQGVSQEKQSQYAVRQYLANLSAGVPLTIWYSWKNRPDARNEKEKNFGLLEASGSSKASFEALRSAWSSLQGYSLDGTVDLGSGEQEGLLFRQGTRRKLALWSSGSEDLDVRLPAFLAPFAPRGRAAKLRRDVQILEQQW